MLDGDTRRIKLAQSLMSNMPGSPVVRYGDEIGMGDNLSLPGRNAVRTPMQWANQKNAANVQRSVELEPYGYRWLRVGGSDWEQA